MFAQDRVNTLETSSEAYQLVNAALTMHLASKTPLDMKLGVRNLLNEEYIDHLSRIKNIGMASPGLNAFIEIKININHKLN